ncbi:hypothetical protein ASE36_19715 [Rhizobium sp. Root274]|uniref:hypothetical protein n=1 Tax=unclassified Rhizobium TaxID=2613769 RepID=UPI000712482D|nr:MULTISPECIES: hypothetical protein [unclassified Rhizobium]KQW27177.1 hypothetical protein ASC71_19205 [Rhizobium sp. Root1240]KRD26653.1 hypothetical protein ASE36_19715 [Rhizobium sp. Root274]
MNSRLPPVPEDNRSHKGTGETGAERQTDDRHFSPEKDPDKLGQHGNSKLNTTHQGYQQDR